MPDQPDEQPEMLFVDPVSGLEIRDLAPAQDEAAAAILAGIPALDGNDRSRTALAEHRATPKAGIYGAQLGGVLVGVFGLRREGMANDLAMIAVDPQHRRRGIGRSMLQDALRRSGRRPLVVQAPETVVPFFRTCGFKPVGRRVQPDGSVHFRLGWHAPGAHFKGGTTSALDHRPLGVPPRDGSADHRR